jgi:hypothetical protein
VLQIGAPIVAFEEKVPGPHFEHEVAPLSSE